MNDDEEVFEKIDSQENLPSGEGRTYIPQEWYRAVAAATGYLALLLEIKNTGIRRDELKEEFLSPYITVR